MNEDDTVCCSRSSLIPFCLCSHSSLIPFWFCFPTSHIQVQFCVERAIELTLHQLSDTGDDDVLLRDALRDMIEVLVDDQVCSHAVHACSPFPPLFAKLLVKN
jgi:hypothetical protein